jgi:hypothetical protein
VSAVTKDWLESRPRGTVITVSDTSGHRFELVAEGRTFRDFILHTGTPSFRLQGRRARFGGTRLFWAADVLARWTADGLCTIEVATSHRSDS